MKTGIFCRTESVAMTLKIMCTHPHYVTLGSHGKMASSHRVTNLEKIPVRISKDEAPTPLAFVYFRLVISSFLSLVRCVAFQSFSFCLLQLSQQARPHQGACLACLYSSALSSVILISILLYQSAAFVFLDGSWVSEGLQLWKDWLSICLSLAVIFAVLL